jgi:diguanylate cyclase
MNADGTPPLKTAAPAAAPAVLAKGALRRLAAERIEPTPENYTRAYRHEAGEATGAGVLPSRAQRLVELVALRAFDTEVTYASGDFAKAMAEGRWDQAERALEAVPRLGAAALARLIERILEGAERGGPKLSAEQRRAGIQRVLDASRKDVRSLERRLSQMVESWEGDTRPGVPTVASAARSEAPASAEPVADAAPRQAAASVVPSSTPTVDAGLVAVPPSAEWIRLIDAIGVALQRTLPQPDGAHKELADGIAELSSRLRAEGPTAELLKALEQRSSALQQVVRHRHHLFELLGLLTLELTASLSDLAENDSWVRGQCDAMRVKIEEGLTARGVRAVTEMLRSTRRRHAELRGERERARDALKVLINRMLAEVGELGSRTGGFHESVGRYAAVIEEADTLESLTGVVREMVEETRMVQSLVQQAQQRLQEEHAKATDLSHRVTELEVAMKRLSDEVSTDQLTQIANRRGLLVSFEMERARAERTGRPLSIGLIDIDNFKRLNDELGHSAGDEALKSLASLIRNNLRPTDHVARYGGEEFVVLLPETAVEEGEKVLTRLQRTLTGGLFMHKEQQVFVTFSAGVTLHRLHERIEDTLERADLALYEAKHAGKNRTCIG